MLPRFHIDNLLVSGEQFFLPEPAACHVRVLRMQPRDSLLLFNGAGGQWRAQVVEMGRRTVKVLTVSHDPTDPAELPHHATLAVCVPANDRMDFLVEKATELGVRAVQPLISERSVLRLSGERALRKQNHWQAVAVAACEQSGRTLVPRVYPILTLARWLSTLGPPIPNFSTQRVLLSTGDAPAVNQLIAEAVDLTILSGPEGGFSPLEQQAAVSAQFRPVSLGHRILRADTAPLAILAWWMLSLPISR